MKQFRFSGLPTLRQLRFAAGAILATGFFSSAQAATDISFWASLNPHNSQVLEKQVREFNRSQNDVRVSMRLFDNPEQIEPALDKSIGQKQLPHLVQLPDNRWPEGIAAQKHIKPLYALLGKQTIPDAKWFIAPQNGFMRDTQGRLLALPYMAEVPVMYYNVSAFQKAGLSPAQPQRSWAGLQDQLVDLANKATRRCPATTDQPVSINLENLAAVNNQFFTSHENGYKGKAVPSFTFDVVYVRHLALMIGWVRTELLVGPALDAFATQRFANNECSVLLSGSSNIGAFRNTGALSFGVAGLPYYPQVTSKPGNPFLDGSGVWATAGHTPDEEKAMVQFLSWLSQPRQAAAWYQQTGYLPLTEQAFALVDEPYYKPLGDWKNLVAVYNRPPSSTERNFRINNYPQIRAMFQQTLRDAFNGQMAAATALSTASAEAAKLLQK